jgi:hypothetical protein
MSDKPMGLVRDMPEEWRPVVGFEGLYSSSSHGRIRSEERSVIYRGLALRRVPARILSPGIAAGYEFVQLWRDGTPTRMSVHTAVLTAFVGPAPSPAYECAHGDGNPRNNRQGNLRWATGRENQADRVFHGTANRGERHGMAKLTAPQVLAIRADARSHAALAVAFGVSRSAVTLVKSRKGWSWLNG